MKEEAADARKEVSTSCVCLYLFIIGDIEQYWSFWDRKRWNSILLVVYLFIKSNGKETNNILLLLLRILSLSRGC